MNQPARLDPAVAALLMQMRLPIRREFGVNLDIYDQDAATQFVRYGRRSSDATLQRLAAALQTRLTDPPSSPVTTPPVADTPSAEASVATTRPASSSPASTADKTLAELKRQTVQALTTICGPMAEIMWASEIKNCLNYDDLERQMLVCRQMIHETLGKAKADAFWKQVLPLIKD